MKKSGKEGCLIPKGSFPLAPHSTGASPFGVPPLKTPLPPGVFWGAANLAFRGAPLNNPTPPLIGVFKKFFGAVLVSAGIAEKIHFKTPVFGGAPPVWGPVGKIFLGARRADFHFGSLVLKKSTIIFLAKPGEAPLPRGPAIHHKPPPGAPLRSSFVCGTNGCAAP
ncbi:MAG: hypothetical protein CM15mP74_15780 [Halieaceae bacterium]|nr:MAG: hypothetical protein CM15mP74_15780 [Halieaceae bacterium]